MVSFTIFGLSTLSFYSCLQYITDGDTKSNVIVSYVRIN